MKNAALVMMILTMSLMAAAKQKVLDCNISLGNHQQIMVEENGGELTLMELDSEGILHKRALSQKEFNSGKLQLFTDDFGGKNTFTKLANGEWSYFYKLDSLEIRAIGDCR